MREYDGKPRVLGREAGLPKDLNGICEPALFAGTTGIGWRKSGESGENDRFTEKNDWSVFESRHDDRGNHLPPGPARSFFREH